MIDKIPSKESMEIPETVLNYLKNKHQTLKNNYRTECNQGREDCFLIACDIAKLFRDAGFRPYISILRDDTLLKPLIYNEKVEFVTHKVCCCNGQVFDPILEAPVPIEDYTQSVFGKDLKMNDFISYEKIPEFIINNR